MKQFLGILLATAVTALQNEQGSSEVSTFQAQTNFSHDTEADSAEYNFWSGVLAIIARHDTQHRLWAHTFQDLVNASAYEQFGPPENSSLSRYNWDSAFPSALHKIKWFSINPQWGGLQDNGYIAALKAIPLLLHNAQCEAYLNEIRTIVHFGRKAVIRQRVLEAYPGFEDVGQTNRTTALHEAVDQIENNLEFDGLGEPNEEFRGKTDSQERHCRRVQNLKCFDVQMCYNKNMTGPCFYADNSCSPTSFSYNIKCQNLRYERADIVTSINTNGGCIILYAFSNCQRVNNRVLLPFTKGHFSLAEIGFDNEVRSWRPC